MQIIQIIQIAIALSNGIKPDFIISACISASFFVKRTLIALSVRFSLCLNFKNLDGEIKIGQCSIVSG